MSTTQFEVMSIPLNDWVVLFIQRNTDYRKGVGLLNNKNKMEEKIEEKIEETKVSAEVEVNPERNEQ